MGVVPLQQNYSNYGFGALANNNTNNNDINLSVSGSYQPGRGEYAFMRSIGVDGINGNGQSLKDEVMVALGIILHQARMILGGVLPSMFTTDVIKFLKSTASSCMSMPMNPQT